MRQFEKEMEVFAERESLQLRKQLSFAKTA